MSDSSRTPTRTLHLRIAKKPDAITVHCRGDLTAEVAELLRDEVKKAVADGNKRIVLNLGEIASNADARVAEFDVRTTSTAQAASTLSLSRANPWRSPRSS